MPDRSEMPLEGEDKEGLEDLQVAGDEQEFIDHEEKLIENKSENDEREEKQNEE